MNAEVRVASEAADAAAAVIAAHTDGPRRVDHKGSVDLVTEVDRACEDAIREVLVRHLPDIPVLGEEGGGAEHTGTRWVVDPIDGTTNFVHGYPFVAVSIALEVDHEPVAACLLDPLRGIRYTAARGLGARCGDRPMQVSDCRTLDRALIGTGFAYDRRERPDFYLDPLRAVMTRCQGIRRGGAAALELALLADGRLDGFWEYTLKRWDVAAGVLLIEEAGGRVQAIGGGPLPSGIGIDILASNPWIHDELALALESA